MPGALQHRSWRRARTRWLGLLWGCWGGVLLAASNLSPAADGPPTTPRVVYVTNSIPAPQSNSVLPALNLVVSLLLMAGVVLLWVKVGTLARSTSRPTPLVEARTSPPDPAVAIGSPATPLASDPVPSAPAGWAELIAAPFAELRAALLELRDNTNQLQRTMSAISDRLEAMAARDQRQAVNESLQLNDWPLPFGEGGPLAVWRDRIVDRLGQADPAARSLYDTLAQFAGLARKTPPPVGPLAAALHEMSLRAYPFWKAGGWDMTDTPVEWQQAFQQHLTRLGVPLQIKLVFAQDRFDLNTMFCADGSSETRISVREPLSWIVWDTSAPTARVAHLGHVIT